MNNILIFCDFEMTGLTMKDQPISVGICTAYADGVVKNSFYAEFNDYDIRNCSVFVLDHVIPYLMFNDNADFISTDASCGTLHVQMKGSTEEISKALIDWLEDIRFRDAVQSNGANIQFVGDCMHYDLCHFLELFGGAIDCPEYVSPIGIDLNNFIASKYIEMKPFNSPKTLVETEHEAFDTSRERMLEEFDIRILGDKHNSMYDAKVIAALYHKLVK